MTNFVVFIKYERFYEIWNQHHIEKVEMENTSIFYKPYFLLIYKPVLGSGGFYNWQINW